MRTPRSNQYLIPPPHYGFRERWYKRPEFYVPIAVTLFILGGFAIYLSMLLADLKNQAATFDLKKLEQMESASVIVDRNQKIFGQIYVENRETIPYEQLPLDLVNAIVAVEDAKFYQHHGYALSGILRATIKNLTSGRVRQGASTITQQLARNSFALKGKTFRRKLLEIFLARRIEDNFNKQKILELYLNRIYFGGGLYGAEAAARGYFGKHAREMSLNECATLAGIVKSPNRLSPWSDKSAARDARNYALIRMRDQGYIDNAKIAATQSEELIVGNRQNAQGQNYAVDYIRQQVINAVGWDRAMNEGFRIRTTIDADLQKVAEESIRKNLDKAEQQPGYDHQTYAQYSASFRAAKSNGTANAQPAPEYLQGAVIALNNDTGGILVLVGGRDFEHNQYDRALQAKRPAGTAMLPFVYATAFEQGMFPGTLVDDSPLDNRAVMIGGMTGILGEWGPESADNRYEGIMTAREALAKSKNGAAVRIGMDAGLDETLQLCRNAGFRSPLRPYPATLLGSSEVTLSELALAYTVFPNGGSRVNAPHILDRIEEKDGTVVWDAQRELTKQNVIKPESAYEVHSCLVDALESGTGKTARTQFDLKKFPAAGKTGTAYDFTDALFAGYTNSITCAVWAGFDKPQKIYRGAFGREIALPVWVDIMNTAASHYPPKELPRPASLKEVEICTRSGMLATDKCYDTIKGPTGDAVRKRTTYIEIATQSQMPTELCHVHGEPKPQVIAEAPSNEPPRAQAAADLSDVRPVALKSSTLLAENDPYNSLKATVIPKVEEREVARTENEPPDKIDNGTRENVPKGTATETAAEVANKKNTAVTAGEDGKPVLRAIPVQPQAEETPVEVRRAIPVGPMDEVEQGALLKAATPRPSEEEE
ncbi:MAG TPA: PBP1A family penicillin-binding protein [Chthoniobacterales bacterium]|nr:PBP1A family penicillin-binding protein [Chthoniobacterales bacterium]